MGKRFDAVATLAFARHFGTVAAPSQPATPGLGGAMP